ncbi:MAG: hypothetical protein IKD43_04415 [Clostridia bacterium]|nr:hypothetical protein [Clostridia bacterium]
MSKIKRFITIAALAVMFVLTLSFAIGTLPFAKTDAYAATYTPSALFSPGPGGTVGTNKPESASAGNYHVEFTFVDGGTVQYRRDLALKWFEAESNAASTRANPAVAKYFSLSFSFSEVNFESFEIVLESAEENYTKVGFSTNTLRFEKSGNGFNAAVRDSSFDADEDVDENPVYFAYQAGQDIAVSISEPVDGNEGDFSVMLAVGAGQPQEIGTFTNIGGYFIEYRSSAATTPQTPMTFKAELAKTSGSNEPELHMLMKSLNGQTFEVGTDGRVEDNAYPVLVLSEAVYSFRLGQRFNLTYEAIDVCDDSVTVTRSYYMLKKDGNDYKKPDESASSSDYKSLSTNTFFMPTSDTEEEEAYVSIRFKLYDGTTEHDDYFVYLDWYAANDEVVTTKGTANNAFDYILVNRTAESPKYIGIEAVADGVDANTNVVSKEAEDAAKQYQTLVEEAAENLSAGEGAYIYLPSLRGLIESDYADYRNLRFSVYYYKPNTVVGEAASSNTSIRYNNLRFEVDQVGEYRFRVIAQDAQGNEMQYYDQDGELVTVNSDNVWDIEGIPEFSFYVNYEGPFIEAAGEQNEGYRDKTYSAKEFEIIALGGYQKEYTLYYFNSDALPNGEDAPTYADFVKNVDKFMEDYLAQSANQADREDKLLWTIEEFDSEIDEDDERWDETDNVYAWDPQSRSFNPPQRGYYIVQVDVTDSVLINKTVTAYQVIYIRNPTDTITGVSKWLQNNTTSVVLFSVAAVLLVAFLVVWFVKPNESKVEDVDLATLKGKKNRK